MSEKQIVGQINITVSDKSVEYDTEFSPGEVVFWLETLKSMVIKSILDDDLK